MEINDPCDAAKIEDFSEQVFLYAMIGAGSRTFEMPEPKDDVSLLYDAPGDPERGYLTCEERKFWMKARSGSLGAYAYTKLTADYAKIERDQQKHIMTLTYGSNNSINAGLHVL